MACFWFYLIFMHNYGIFHFKDVNATSKVPTMILAISRQEFVSALLDTLEIPVNCGKPPKVNLNAIINLKTKSIVIIFPFLNTVDTTYLVVY